MEQNGLMLLRWGNFSLISLKTALAARGASYLKPIPAARPAMSWLC